MSRTVVDAETWRAIHQQYTYVQCAIPFLGQSRALNGMQDIHISNHRLSVQCANLALEVGKR